jgi:hypothetical protein
VTRRNAIALTCDCLDPSCPSCGAELDRLAAEQDEAGRQDYAAAYHEALTRCWYDDRPRVSNGLLLGKVERVLLEHEGGD